VTSGVLFDLKRFAIHDGPGIRMTVFMKGCPLECCWCHNPEGRNPEPEQIESAQNPESHEIVGESWSATDLLKEIEKERPFFEQSGGGVTFSGGEPLFQPGFLLKMLRLCRAAGIHTAIDTCGYADCELFTEVSELADIFLFDLKLIDEATHKRHTGVSNKRILQNLALLDERYAPIYLRFPLIPGITDSEKNIQATIDKARGLKALKLVQILPYHGMSEGKYRRLGLAKPSIEGHAYDELSLNRVQKAFQDAGLEVSRGGH